MLNDAPTTVTYYNLDTLYEYTAHIKIKSTKLQLNYNFHSYNYNYKLQLQFFNLYNLA